ncbi:MAG: diaminopimelate epimerase [Oscillospiraceae bacterium]|jgi:diaminopimelate epimerase|nr:diaminopimelate epimerase [Oscillospiraceae bacterium]
MKFTKMQGCGNDYVYVNCFEETVSDRPGLSIRVSDRHFGIGSDGLVCICPSDAADFKMDMYNADGSSAQMCGNGIRCVGKYVFDKGLTDKTTLRIETASGIKTLGLNIEDGTVKTVRVEMGSPELRPQYIPIAEHGRRFINRSVIVGDEAYFVTALAVGNPHAVVFVPDTDALDLKTLGPRFENHPLFPERVNTEFVQVLDKHTLKMRVWERGSGETLACGTGATAALVAAALNGHTGDSATVRLLGGELFIVWDRAGSTLYMTGPAVTVFDGELYGYGL